MKSNRNACQLEEGESLEHYHLDNFRFIHWSTDTHNYIYFTIWGELAEIPIRPKITVPVPKYPREPYCLRNLYPDNSGDPDEPNFRS